MTEQNLQPNVTIKRVLIVTLTLLAIIEVTIGCLVFLFVIHDQHDAILFFTPSYVVSCLSLLFNFFILIHTSFDIKDLKIKIEKQKKQVIYHGENVSVKRKSTSTNYSKVRSNTIDYHDNDKTPSCNTLIDNNDNNNNNDEDELDDDKHDKHDKQDKQVTKLKAKQSGTTLTERLILQEDDPPVAIDALNILQDSENISHVDLGISFSDRDRNINGDDDDNNIINNCKDITRHSMPSLDARARGGSNVAGDNNEDIVENRNKFLKKNYRKLREYSVVCFLIVADIAYQITWLFQLGLARYVSNNDNTGCRLLGMSSEITERIHLLLHIIISIYFLQYLYVFDEYRADIDHYYNASLKCIYNVFCCLCYTCFKDSKQNKKNTRKFSNGNKRKNSTQSISNPNANTNENTKVNDNNSLFNISLKRELVLVFITIIISFASVVPFYQYFGKDFNYYNKNTDKDEDPECWIKQSVEDDPDWKYQSIECVWISLVFIAFTFQLTLVLYGTYQLYWLKINQQMVIWKAVSVIVRFFFLWLIAFSATRVFVVLVVIAKNFDTRYEKIQLIVAMHVADGLIGTGNLILWRINQNIKQEHQQNQDKIDNDDDQSEESDGGIAGM